MRLSLYLGVVSSFIATVAAHGSFRAMWINGVDYGSYCSRQLSAGTPGNPMLFSDPNLACRENLSSRSPNVCTVKPGDIVTVEHNYSFRASCTRAFLAEHFGPVMVYMASVPNATTSLGSEANWFKIFEKGLLSNNPPYWAVNQYMANCGHVSFTIPDVAPGPYLLRGETIALHYALTESTQFYSACFQLQVTGNGTGKPTDTVKFPGAYSGTDPGVLFDIYARNISSYPIPGPRPYGYIAPPVANTPYPTTASWNTQLLPRTIPPSPNGFSIPLVTPAP